MCPARGHGAGQLRFPPSDRGAVPVPVRSTVRRVRRGGQAGAPDGARRRRPGAVSGRIAALSGAVHALPGRGALPATARPTGEPRRPQPAALAQRHRRPVPVSASGPPWAHSPPYFT